METDLIHVFYLMLALTICVVILPLRYLRSITRQVLVELCDRSGTGAEFWLRTADVLAVAGSLILVLLFGRITASPIESLRLTLGMAMIGVFIAVMFVASTIWRQASRTANRPVGQSRTAKPAAIDIKV